jgi:hypothetical protein
MWTHVLGTKADNVTCTYTHLNFYLDSFQLYIDTARNPSFSIVKDPPILHADGCGRVREVEDFPFMGVLRQKNIAKIKACL